MRKVFIAGHRGMVGSAIVRQLQKHDDVDLILRTRAELDLTSQQAVRTFFEKESIDQIYLAAAKVGGIIANSSYPADFIYENLMIEANIIHSAHLVGIHDLLFLGSSCIYPRLAPQPMKEDALLTGVLEPTNEPYAIAKIAGIKLCESYNRQYQHNYRSVMPTNLYGPHDNFHLENAHVIPALLRKFHEAASTGANEVICWGSGKPLREFLHVDDMASASIFVMGLDVATYNANTEAMQSHINVGTGQDCTIRDLARVIAKVTAYKGSISFDPSKPDGSPRKLMDVSRLAALGWQAKIPLEEGLEETYQWFIANPKSRKE